MIIRELTAEAEGATRCSALTCEVFTPALVCWVLDLLWVASRWSSGEAPARAEAGPLVTHRSGCSHADLTESTDTSGRRLVSQILNVFREAQWVFVTKGSDIAHQH